MLLSYLISKKPRTLTNGEKNMLLLRCITNCTKTHDRKNMKRGKDKHVQAQISAQTELARQETARGGLTERKKETDQTNENQI